MRRALTPLGFLASGIGVGLGFEPLGWWPLAIAALAALYWLTSSIRPRRAAGYGYLFGLGLFGVSIPWVYPLGIWVAVLLVAAMSCWGMLIVWGTRMVTRLPLAPLWMAAVWTLTEFAWGRFPFGGFGWLRLAYLTPDQPLSGYLGFLGTPTTGFIVALVAATLSVARSRRAAIRGGVTVAALFAIGGALLFVPPAAPSGSVTVGMVQGNTNGSPGSESMGYARSVTNNHVSETVMLMSRAKTGMDPMPQFIVWPENSTDIDPTRDRATRELIEEAARLSGLPILVGAVMAGPGDNERQTSALWWADGGIQARIDKRNLVPFGEYIPMRDVLLPIAPILEEVGAQSVPGDGPRALDAALPDGRQIRIGNISCFELAWDDTVYDTVRDGGELITVQSNNSTYTHTAQPRQQFVITRTRAMELRRDIVVATTSSFSGLIRADGTVVDKTEEATSASRTYDVATRDTVSAGVRIGPWLERVLALAGVAGIFWGQFGRVRFSHGRRTRKSPRRHSDV